MAIWYLNMIEENKRLIEDAVGMKVFQYITSKHWSHNGKRNRKADVGRSGDCWGVRFYEDNMWIKDELYKGHSERYAYDAEKNYVQGIKNVR